MPQHVWKATHWCRPYVYLWLVHITIVKPSIYLLRVRQIAYFNEHLANTPVRNHVWGDICGTFAFTMLRFGPVAWVAQILFACRLMGFPITTDLSVWYSGIGLTGVCLLLAMTLYAFHTSVGGRPIFGRAILEE
jgi:hypothetical protein